MERSNSSSRRTESGDVGWADDDRRPGRGASVILEYPAPELRVHISFLVALMLTVIAFFAGFWSGLFWGMP